MRDSLGHRGPDGSDIFERDKTRLAMTRLSVVGGDAPIIQGDGPRIVFNGEIYNHRDLRRALERDGYVFKTQTDTEVVLQLYRRDGLGCFHQLEGMFALAILDGDRLVLARDRLGIKPLYVAHAGGVFVFASEIKAILQSGLIEPELDPIAIADHYVLRMICGNRTWFKGITLFPKGHVQVIRRSGAPSGTLAAIAPPEPYQTRPTQRRSIGFEAAVERVAERLEAAVATHMFASTEIGATLSGGIDSSLLVALARPYAPGRLKTFAIADSADNPDLIEARGIAQRLGTDHCEEVMAFSSYLAAVPELIAAEECPTSLFGLPLFMLSRMASERVKACLHGEGADEVFGGYSEYTDRRVRLPGYARRLKRARALCLPVSQDALETIRRQSPKQPVGQYLENIFDLNLGDQLQQRHLLPVDKCGMAHGLEYRVPYLDDPFFSETSTLAIDHLVRYELGIGKRVLKHVFLKVLGPMFLDTVLRAKAGGPSAATQYLDRFDRLCAEVLPERFPTHQEHSYRFYGSRDALVFHMFHDQFMTHKGKPSERRPVADYLLEFSKDRLSRSQLKEITA